MAESEIVLNRHVFISIFGQETGEMWRITVKVSIVLPLVLIKKNNFSATKTNFEKPPAGGGARD